MIVSRKKIKDNGTQKAVQRQRMGILLCEQNFRDVWRRNEIVRAGIGQLLHTHTHTLTTAAKLVVRIVCVFSHVPGVRLPSYTRLCLKTRRWDTDSYWRNWRQTCVRSLATIRSVSSQTGTSNLLLLVGTL